MRSSFTFARFQRSTATESSVSMEPICAMMLRASASFEVTGPGSAVAAEATANAIATTQTTAGMWRILDLIAGSPSGGRNYALPRTRGTSQGREGNSLLGQLQPENKPKSAQSCLLTTITNTPF